MIRLHPAPDADHNCPYCQLRLDVRGWYIPGMRNLAEMVCPKCGRFYYGDLPSGHGLYYPMLLERDLGKVHDPNGVPWFAGWLRLSYAKRSIAPLGFSVEEKKVIRNPLLLNCLDTLYGHCLLKLLNAQYYLDHRRDFDLIVLAPRFLRWLVPDGTAAIWTVDLPLSRGTEWNDWLAAELRRRISAFSECWLSVGFSHPHPNDYNIERFTRVRPFAIDEWQNQMKRPTVTFIWRNDRVWNFKEEKVGQLTGKIKDLRGKKVVEVERQRRGVIELANALHVKFADLDFGVVGIDKRGGFPEWIADLREIIPDESIERMWCERYASSHIIIGVHGSSMLLPSAHAGAVVELMPHERWGNTLQDILFSPIDIREALFRCRIVPSNASVGDLVSIVTSMLVDHPYFLVNMRREFCDHDRIQQASAWVAARRGGLPMIPDMNNKIVD